MSSLQAWVLSFLCYWYYSWTDFVGVVHCNCQLLGSNPVPHQLSQYLGSMPKALAGNSHLHQGLGSLRLHSDFDLDFSKSKAKGSHLMLISNRKILVLQGFQQRASKASKFFSKVLQNQTQTMQKSPNHWPKAKHVKMV